MYNTSSLTESCMEVLRQGKELLVRMDSWIYTSPGPIQGRSCIGAHMRHCLDFFICFLEGLPSGKVDYNQRERDELVEKDLPTAMARIEAVMAELERIGQENVAEALLVRAEQTQEEDWGASSVSRELQFLLSHTIHHYALIGLMAKLQGVEPPQDFGIAPSTLSYWRRAS